MPGVGRDRGQGGGTPGCRGRRVRARGARQRVRRSQRRSEHVRAPPGAARRPGVRAPRVGLRGHRPPRGGGRCGRRRGRGRPRYSARAARGVRDRGRGGGRAAHDGRVGDQCRQRRAGAAKCPHRSRTPRRSGRVPRRPVRRAVGHRVRCCAWGARGHSGRRGRSGWPADHDGGLSDGGRPRYPVASRAGPDDPGQRPSRLRGGRGARRGAADAGARSVRRRAEPRPPRTDP